jgi:UTP--glucose-1-phosphate uridylyltransferase
MDRVSSAVIPAAGYGTRWLPASKSIPKEMLPVWDRPGIQVVVEEAVAAGCERILIILSAGKSAIEDHFDRAPDLERALEEKKKTEQLQNLRRLWDLADIHFIRQHEMKGLGHAVLQAESFAGGGPVAVLLPDDLFFCQPPAIGQLMSAREKHGGSVVALGKYPVEMLKGYGVPALAEWADERTVRIRHVVEKPPPEKMESDMGVVGRYVLGPEIFQALKNTKPGALGEIQITDAIDALARSGKVYGHLFQGDRFDAGNPLGMLEATVSLALRDPTVQDKVRRLLEGLLKKN